MSRIKSIDELQVKAHQAQRDLGDEIHRVFYEGRPVLYQGDGCYTENRADWIPCEVIGPHNQTMIIIRDAKHNKPGMPGYVWQAVEGTSMRLDLKEEKPCQS